MTTASNITFAEFREVLSSSWQGLEDKPEETPEGTLRALWFLAAGDPRTIKGAASAELPTLDSAAQANLEALVNDRLNGVPLAHLTGRQSFMGIEMLAGPEALVPRKETELLGNASLSILNRLADQRSSVRLVDLCTGSGNLALALAYNVPCCRVFGSDLSPDAVQLARRNAQYLNLENRVEFREGDLFAAFDSERFRGQLDMVVCNPPYISSGKVRKMPQEISEYEPKMAFDGGPFGLTIILQLIREAFWFLKPNSWLCFEVGSGQGEFIVSKLRNYHQYQEVRRVCSMEGDIRALLARTSE